MTLAVVLLVGAALLARTFIALRSVEPGFDPRQVLTMRMSLTDPRFASTAEVSRLVGTGLEQLAPLPGVELVAASCCLPLENGSGASFVIAGRPLTGSAHGFANWRSVTPSYFDVFRIP